MSKNENIEIGKRTVLKLNYFRIDMAHFSSYFFIADVLWDNCE
jgi:hypothetical protein